MRYLVGGLEHGFYDFPNIWECHHPKWRAHIFQRSWNQQLVRCLGYCSWCGTSFQSHPNQLVATSSIYLRSHSTLKCSWRYQKINLALTWFHPMDVFVPVDFLIISPWFPNFWAVRPPFFVDPLDMHRPRVVRRMWRFERKPFEPWERWPMQAGPVGRNVGTMMIYPLVN